MIKKVIIISQLFLGLFLIHRVSTKDTILQIKPRLVTIRNIASVPEYSDPSPSKNTSSPVEQSSTSSQPVEQNFYDRLYSLEKITTMELSAFKNLTQTLLNSKDLVEKLEALEIVQRVKWKEPRQKQELLGLLKPLTTHENWILQSNAIRSVSSIQDESAAELLVMLLDPKRPEVLKEAIFAIQTMVNGNPSLAAAINADGPILSALQYLSAIGDVNFYNVQVDSISTLGILRSVESLPFLESFLIKKDSDLLVKDSVVEALSNIGSKSSLSALNSHLAWIDSSLKTVKEVIVKTKLISSRENTQIVINEIQSN